MIYKTGISTLLGAQNSRVLGGGVSKLRTGQETDLPGGEHVLTSLQRLPWVPASQLKHCPIAQYLELALHVGPYLSRMIDENVDTRS